MGEGTIKGDERQVGGGETKMRKTHLSTESEKNFILEVSFLGVCSDSVRECLHWSFLSHAHSVEAPAVVCRYKCLMAESYFFSLL